MGQRRKPKGRPLDGILLLDKSLGISSNRALQQVKHLFKAAKAGHTGNLDPLATGLLPICFGAATKISHYLLDADKRYQGSCKLGLTTTTGDSEGEVVKTRPIPELTSELVLSTFSKFLGEISQIPPMFSAIKHQGTPLYKLARNGIEVERKPRNVSIFSFELLKIDGDELFFEVHCSKGTYVRTLLEDVGEILGCGAHLSSLHRTQTGPFGADAMIGFEELDKESEEGGLDALDRHLLPMESALEGWPEAILSANSLFYVQQGQAVQIAHTPDNGLIKMVTENGVFIGIGEILDDGRVGPKRLLHRV